MNKQIKVIVANENSEENSSVCETLKDNNVEVVGTCTNGIQLCELIKNNPQTDVVVLDVLLPNKDGYAVMEETKENNKNIKFIVTTALSSSTFVQKAMSLGAKYYMLKPIDSALLAKRIVEVMNPAKHIEKTSVANSSYKELEEKITNIFITVGIPAHIKGYQFLREAIKLAINKPDIINSITKELYPSIAQKFDTSASKVERAIRHAIEVAWNRGKIENINNVFGLKVYSNNEKPTNGEFIALVADKMLLEG